MKKIALTLAALAALSTSSFAAGNRSYDLQDSEYWTSSGVPTGSASAAIISDVKGLADAGGSGETAFERMQRLSYENDHDRH